MALIISPEVTAIGSTSSNTTGGVIIIQGDSSGISAGKSGNTITLSHVDTSSASNLTASGRTYVTALTFDGFGHVTGYSTGTETVVDTNTTYSAGTDLGLSGTTFNVSSASTNTVSTLVKRDASGNFSAGTITATFSGNLTGNVTGNVTGSSGSCTGNAASATTAGSITGQANSATITATSNNTANQIVLRDASGNFSAGTITATFSGNLTGNVTGNVTGSSGSCTGNAATATTAGSITSQANSATISAVSTNTASTIVLRDASGNFSAGTITASLTGNVTGNVTGSSGSCTGNAASATTAGSITGQANSATITATSNNTANQIVLRDASGNFSAGLITATATTARYSDLAENYLADAIYEPGTVLMIGGEKEVTIAQEETTKVAGVVSTAPGYIMNSECTGNFVVAIALTGRVPCKVVGTVKKGDLMISAGDGMAKSTGVYSPKIGQVIGKALENFNGNMGTIEVMVGRF